MSNFENFLLTVGIYYKKMTDKKSQIVISSDKKPIFNNFIKSYFDINEEYSENDYRAMLSASEPPLVTIKLSVVKSVKPSEW